MRRKRVANHPSRVINRVLLRIALPTRSCTPPSFVKTTPPHYRNETLEPDSALPSAMASSSPQGLGAGVYFNVPRVAVGNRCPDAGRCDGMADALAGASPTAEHAADSRDTQRPPGRQRAPPPPPIARGWRAQAGQVRRGGGGAAARRAAGVAGPVPLGPHAQARRRPRDPRPRLPPPPPAPAHAPERPPPRARARTKSARARRHGLFRARVRRGRSPRRHSL
jgi:hypothetical protein